MLNQLNKLVQELKSKQKDPESPALTDYLNSASVQLIFLESIIGAKVSIIEDLSKNFKPDPARANETIQEYVNASLVLGKELMERFPHAWEYSTAEDEYASLLDTVEFSISCPGHDRPEMYQVGLDDQITFTRAYRTVQMLFERASWRVPMIQELPMRPPPSGINATEQMNLLTSFEALQKLLEGKNESAHLDLANLHSYGFGNLTSAAEYHIILLEALLNQLLPHVTNPAQYFPVHYVRMLIEEYTYRTAELDREFALIHALIKEGTSHHEARTLSDLTGHGALWVRLTEGAMAELFHSIEYPLIKHELDGVKALLGQWTTNGKGENATQIELIHLSQTMDRVERTLQHLFATAQWRAALVVTDGEIHPISEN